MAVSIRVPENQVCHKCGGSFKRVILKSISNIAYRCPKCLTVPDRYYLDIHHNGERPRIFSDKQGKPLDTIARAADLLSHIQYEIDNHIFDITKYRKSDIKNFLFENLIKRWLDLKEKQKIATAYKYQEFTRNYFSFFKGFDVREIKTSTVDLFYNDLPEHLSNKTKKNILSSLHAFLNWLLRMEYIAKVPVFPKIEVNLPDWQWVDVDGQDKLLSAIPAEDRSIFLFEALHGCRPGEARALKVKDFDFLRITITIRRTFSGRASNELVEHTKTKRIRKIPIHPEMTSLLKGLCDGRFGEEFVFINPRTNKPYSEASLLRTWDKVRNDVGMNIKPYEGLRHSFASQRACMGYDLLRIGKILGHTDIRTTQRYSHINLNALKPVMDIKTVIKPSVAEKTDKNNIANQEVAI